MADMRGKLFWVALLILIVISGAAVAERKKEEKRKPTDIEKGFMIFESLMKTVKATGPLNQNEKRAIGRAVAMEVFRRYGKRTDNSDLNRYVTLVGQTVAANSGPKDQKYRFAVIENKEMNAFAAPGGFIFITTGLLKAINTEAQLAGVLAHEVAHVNKNHMVNAIQRARGLQGLAELSAVAMNKNPKEFSKIVSAMTDILFTKGLDKEMEYEADREGAVYSSRAGYHPGGLLKFLKKLKASEGKTQSVFFSTHPSTGARIEKLKWEIKKTGGGSVLGDRYARWVK